MGMWKMTKQEAELIDTLWNVNGLTKLKHNMALAMELIDTLWNVND